MQISCTYEHAPMHATLVTCPSMWLHPSPHPHPQPHITTLQPFTSPPKYHVRVSMNQCMLPPPALDETSTLTSPHSNPSHLLPISCPYEHESMHVVPTGPRRDFGPHLTTLQPFTSPPNIMSVWACINACCPRRPLTRLQPSPHHTPTLHISSQISCTREHESMHATPVTPPPALDTSSSFTSSSTSRHHTSKLHIFSHYHVRMSMYQHMWLPLHATPPPLQEVVGVSTSRYRTYHPKNQSM